MLTKLYQLMLESDDEADFDQDIDDNDNLEYILREAHVNREFELQ